MGRRGGYARKDALRRAHQDQDQHGLIFEVCDIPDDGGACSAGTLCREKRVLDVSIRLFWRFLRHGMLNLPEDC